MKFYLRKFALMGPCLLLVSSCGSMIHGLADGMQSKETKENTSVINRAVAIFNSTKDQKKVLEELKKLKKVDGFYKYQVNTGRGNDEKAVVSFSPEQIEAYFGSYNQTIKKLNDVCGKGVRSNFPKIDQISDLKICYQENVESFIPSQMHTSTKGKVLFGADSVEVSPSGAVEILCNGAKEKVRNLYSSLIKCYASEKVAELERKINVASKEEQAANDADFKNELKMDEEAKMDGTANKLLICPFYQGIDAIDEELKVQKEVQKRTGTYNVGRVNLLHSDKVRLENMIKKMQTDFTNQGQKVSTKSCSDLMNGQ